MNNEISEQRFSHRIVGDSPPHVSHKKLRYSYKGFTCYLYKVFTVVRKRGLVSKFDKTIELTQDPTQLLLVLIK